MGMRSLVANSFVTHPPSRKRVPAKCVLWIPALTSVLILSACTKYRVATDDGGGGDAMEAGGRSQGGSGGATGTGGAGMGGAGIGGAHDAGADMIADVPADAVSGTGGALGANGVTCQTYLQCASGNCTNGLCCAAGQSGCGSSCLDLTTDNANCGTCGNPCAGGKETCTNGSCKRNDGQSCTAPAQCVSSVCTLFFVDADGDHYGVGRASAGFCTITSPPLGYAMVGGDCCDSNPAVNPGISGFPQAAAPTCPDGAMVSPWDYDCDGVVKHQFYGQIGSACGPLPDCVDVPLPESSCGTLLTQTCDCFLNGTSCVLDCSNAALTLGCH
jgi:hypothetical protein